MGGLGAAEGNPKDAPAPRQFTEGWGTASPDIVFEMPNAFEVPTSGTIEYQYVVIPTGFTKDQWVAQGEVRPGNRAVTHHVIVFVREPCSTWLREALPGVPFVPKKRQRREEGEKRQSNDDAGGPSELLVGFAPGMAAMILPPGQAKL